MQWYVAQPDGSTTGPCEESDLRSWIMQGHYPATVLVWREGLLDWQPAHSVVQSLPPPLPRLAPDTPPPSMRQQKDAAEKTSPSPQQLPVASFGQIWRLAWGQALKEHNEKYGKTPTKSAQVDVQLIASKRVEKPKKNSRKKSFRVIKFVLAIFSAILLAPLGFYIFSVPVKVNMATIPPAPSSVLFSVVALSALYGFIGYYLWVWISPLLMSFLDRISTSAVRYFVITVLEPAGASVLSGVFLLIVARFLYTVTAFPPSVWMPIFSSGTT